MTQQPRIPPGVAEHLGYYVYLYVDPRDDRPFYVGKGVGKRLLAHLDDPQASKKTARIAELKAAGLAPRIEVLAHGLKDEETVFRIEAAVIEVLGLGSLTNKVSGWKSLQVGRMSLSDLIGFYAARPARITHPVLLIRVNKRYRRGISARELYEATRGLWRMGPRRESVQYAFAVFHGLVREVYEIKAWHPAGTLPYATRDIPKRTRSPRWEFEGSVAAPDVRDRYLHRSVHAYLKAGSQSPTVYVNVE